MSASREKKTRQDGFSAGPSPDDTANAASKSKIRKNVLIGIAITLVVVLSIGSIVLFRGPYFRNHSTAMMVGDHELTPTMVRYFYSDTFSQMNQTYGSIFSQVFGTGEMQDEIYDEEAGETWGDFVMEQTLEQIRATYAVYDEAMAQGYVLSEAGESSLSSADTMITLYAQYSGVTDDDYVRNAYGSGASKATYMEYERLLTTVAYYEQEVNDNFSYTQEQLNAAYDESPADYSYYNYHSYYISGQSSSEDEEEQAAAMEEAKATAEAMAEESQDNLEAFLAKCNELSGAETYTDGTASLRSNTAVSAMSTAMREWVTDASRQEGDAVAVAYEDYGYYVLYFVSSSDNNYDALDMNLITISASATDSDGNTTMDWDAAKEQLDQLQAEYKGYEDAETAFSELASVYSDDEDTAYSGGAYEYVYDGQFDAALNEWLFDSDREIGETAVVQGDSAYYFVCFGGASGNYRDYLVEQVLRSADYEAWYEATIADAVATKNDFGMKHVNMTLTVQSST